MENIIDATEQEHAKKRQKIPECQYNSGVCCDLDYKHCSRCGWNPIVDEMRKTAIRLGEKRFLRYSARDLSSYEQMLSELFKENVVL